MGTPLQGVEVMNTLTKNSEPRKVTGSTPNWLVASVNKKRSLVHVSFLVTNIMTRYTSRAPKPKRTKSTTRITFNGKTG